MTEQKSVDGETLRPAFPDVNESERPYTLVSYGLPYQDSLVKHVNGFLKAERVYIVASKSLSEQTDKLKVSRQIRVYPIFAYGLMMFYMIFLNWLLQLAYTH